MSSLLHQIVILLCFFPIHAFSGVPKYVADRIELEKKFDPDGHRPCLVYFKWLESSRFDLNSDLPENLAGDDYILSLHQYLRVLHGSSKVEDVKVEAFEYPPWTLAGIRPHLNDDQASRWYFLCKKAVEIYDKNESSWLDDGWRLTLERNVSRIKKHTLSDLEFLFWLHPNMSKASSAALTVNLAKSVRTAANASLWKDLSVSISHSITNPVDRSTIDVDSYTVLTNCARWLDDNKTFVFSAGSILPTITHDSHLSGFDYFVLSKLGNHQVFFRPFWSTMPKRNPCFQPHLYCGAYIYSNGGIRGLII